MKVIMALVRVSAGLALFVLKGALEGAKLFLMLFGVTLRITASVIDGCSQA